MSKVTKQSEFSRSKYNEAKMGAYYTDAGHCRMLSKLFCFPEEDEVCCLEPSIGDGKAILAVTGKEGGTKDNLKIFGVELNGETYQDTSKNGAVNYCLQADFLSDVMITRQAFTFCFMNPPYGMQEDGTRYEQAFLQKVTPYLAKGAVMVFVLPIYVAGTPEFASEWSSQYDTRHFYRFHEKEYAKYKQVVLVGVKREKAERDSEREKWLAEACSDFTKVPEVPADYNGERIFVGRSSESSVTEFMPLTFREEDARNIVEHSPLQNLLREKVSVPPYLIDNLGRPPILPSEGQMYLLAVSGAGQGLVGSEENKDLHLQRGVSRISKRSEYMQDEDGIMKEVEISYPQISFNLIEADGTIRSLQ